MKLAVTCYLKNNNKTLMLHRIKKDNDVHNGKWIGLGGKIEDGESPEEATIREVREESGLIINNLKLVGLLTEPKFKDNEDWYVYIYTSDNFQGELTDCNEGELKWVDDSELLNLELWEGDKLFLNWILEEKFFSAKFYYQDFKLKESNVIFY